MMRVVFHHPSSPEARSELEDKIAIFHAEAVLQYIQNLSCSKEQKLALLQAVIDTRAEEYKHKGGVIP